MNPFLQRDAMRKRGLWLFAVTQCPSVVSIRLSRWFHCISRRLTTSSHFFLGSVALSF